MPPYKSRHRAIVLGGSIAGLLAARVLSEQFENVLILDRDEFSNRAEPRSGAPQDRHIHVLLEAGRRALRQLLPDLIPELIAAGATEYDAIHDFEWISPAGRNPRFPSHLKMLGASRQLIEWGIRQQVKQLPKVELMASVKAIGFSFDVAKTRVSGVIVESGSRQTQEEIAADLVVDTTGRGSRTPQWLAEHGFPQPTETVVDGHLGYASRLVRPPASPRPDWKTFYIQCAPPKRNRGGVIATVEGGNWIVTLAGGAGEYPPHDEVGFRDFIGSLPDSRFEAAYDSANPLTPISANKSTANRMRHYESMTRRPEGLLVLGDAACAFNPVYGQGMSAAAIGALVLQKCLENTHQGLAARFQTRLARANHGLWLLSTGEDYRYQGVTGPPPPLTTRWSHRYLDRVVLAATRSPSVHRRMVEVLHLLRSPTSLFSPRIVSHVLTAREPAR